MGWEAEVTLTETPDSRTKEEGSGEVTIATGVVRTVETGSIGNLTCQSLREITQMGGSFERRGTSLSII